MKPSPMLERLYRERRKMDFLETSFDVVINAFLFIAYAVSALILSAGFGGTQ